MRLHVRAIGAVLLHGLFASAAAGQLAPGRATIESLVFEPLIFEQPMVVEHQSLGVEVLLLENHQLPIATVYAYFRGGYGLFEREIYAPAMGLPAMLRYGGTTTRSPASIDEGLEYRAIQTTFGSAGGSITSTVNTLSEHLEPALDVWRDMLINPGFDEGEIRAWTGRQLENVLRRKDDPSRLAFSEFNRLLYSDHPIGWEMHATDLAPDRVTADRFHEVHQRIVCRENLTLGVTGDVTWAEVEPLLLSLVDQLQPCEAELPEAPVPNVRREAGVFLIERELEQSVIVMAHPTSVRLGDEPDYFSALIGNSVLGGGGFSSRLLSRLRTEEGYAYSASSLWTTPREHEGLLGAITRTQPENTIPAIAVILETMEELRHAPPTAGEVQTTVDQIVNGFVFNFETPGQIVSRNMFYRAQDLPTDWLQRYLSGVQAVRPQDIQNVFAQHLRPDQMTILIVGDPDRIGRAELEALGPVTVLVIR
jgi:zinc protease